MWDVWNARLDCPYHHNCQTIQQWKGFGFCMLQCQVSVPFIVQGVPTCIHSSPQTCDQESIFDHFDYW
jgi:hypothetical protein